MANASSWKVLPEYRKVREEAGGFLNLCYDPEKAAKVTLQPIHRFRFDAAILFSDILVVPHALGQKVTFEAGEGPRLEPIRSSKTIWVAFVRKIYKKTWNLFMTLSVASLPGCLITPH